MGKHHPRSSKRSPVYASSTKLHRAGRKDKSFDEHKHVRFSSGIKDPYEADDEKTTRFPHGSRSNAVQKKKLLGFRDNHKKSSSSEPHKNSQPSSEDLFVKEYDPRKAHDIEDKMEVDENDGIAEEEEHNLDLGQASDRSEPRRRHTTGNRTTSKKFPLGINGQDDLDFENARVSDAPKVRHHHAAGETHGSISPSPERSQLEKTGKAKETRARRNSYELDGMHASEEFEPASTKSDSVSEESDSPIHRVPGRSNSPATERSRREGTPHPLHVHWSSPLATSRRTHTTGISKVRAPYQRKKGVEDDPENWDILEMRAEKGMHWEDIIDVLNAKREAKGLPGTFTYAAVHGRFVRNGPIIAKIKGHKNWNYKNYLNYKTLREPKKKSEQIIGWTRDEEQLLVEKVETKEKLFWEQVAREMQAETGKTATSEICRTRYEVI